MGPGISSFLEFIPAADIAGTKFRSFNVMAFVYFFIWVGIFFWYLLVFEGYDKEKGSMQKLKEM